MGIFDNILLASDLDGTLYNRARQVSEPNRAAIRRFIEEGGRFTVATGRAIQAFEQPRRAIPLNAPVILANGALVYDYDEGRVLRSVPLDSDYLPVCAAVRAAFPEVVVEAHLLTGIWVVGSNETSRAHLAAVQVSAARAPSLTDIPGNWLKALFVGEAAMLRALSDWFRPRYGGQYDVCFSHANLLEMQHKEANKGTALCWLADALSVPPKRVFCVGDQENDLPMLRAAVSFAPANAAPAVRAAARYAAPDCDDHALAAVIDRLPALL
ncbi:MAG: HAD-IIB family hydrolase [Oscillospiraceae bacterium]|jgi:Cof subfamily protein (haloacid dehalogenase superfamily)|nr:HAD-IIB family hydrolase [Oscillospiraceae bacterium]